MVAAACSPSRSADTPMAGWLLFAILLHVPLLLLHLQREPPTAQALQHLKIELRNSVRPEPASPEPPQAQPRPEDAPRQEPAPSAADPMAATVIPPAAPSVSDAPPPSLSSALLLDLARRQAWKAPPAADTRELGVFRSRPPPANWQPRTRPEANLFDDLVAPAQVEVVDRWLAADGSQNVIIKTPSGETYCGRLEAWSPMNPLFEPVAMWRTCGGGGRRTFEMPERYRKSATDNDFPQP